MIPLGRRRRALPLCLTLCLCLLSGLHGAVTASRPAGSAPIAPAVKAISSLPAEMALRVVDFLGSPAYKPLILTPAPAARSAAAPALDPAAAEAVVRRSLGASAAALPAAAERWAELELKAGPLLSDAQTQAALSQASLWTRQRLSPDLRAALDQKMRRLAEALSAEARTADAAAVPAGPEDRSSFARRMSRLGKPPAAEPADACAPIDLEKAVQASGLQGKIAEIKEHAQGVMTIYDFLALEPRPGRGYILGLTKDEAGHRDTYQMIGDLINFTTWDAAYRGLFGRQYPPMERFMEAITRSGLPIMMLVPKDYDKHPQAKHTRAEIDWFLAAPGERMKNVYFVFGGYDLFSEARYRADFGSLPPAERKQAMARALSAHVKSSR